MSQDTEGRPGMPQKEIKGELSFCVFLNKYLYFRRNVSYFPFSRNKRWEIACTLC